MFHSKVIKIFETQVRISKNLSRDEERLHRNVLLSLNILDNFLRNFRLATFLPSFIKLPFLELRVVRLKAIRIGLAFNFKNRRFE